MNISRINIYLVVITDHCRIKHKIFILQVTHSWNGRVLNFMSIFSMFLFQVIQGAVEIPAVFISIFILLKGGRRWPLTITMVLSGVACLLTVPLYFVGANLQWLITSLTMISKFGISSCNAIIPVYTAELYPTTIRNIGVGASNVPAGIALMSVPYLWNFVSFFQIFPY